MCAFLQASSLTVLILPNVGQEMIFFTPMCRTLTQIMLLYFSLSRVTLCAYSSSGLHCAPHIPLVPAPCACMQRPWARCFHWGEVFASLFASPVPSSPSSSPHLWSLLALPPAMELGIFQLMKAASGSWCHHITQDPLWTLNYWCLFSQKQQVLVLLWRTTIK